MVFQVHIPIFPLRGYIERMFYYEGLNPVHEMDRFLPDGNTEFIIDLSEKPQYIYDNETLAEIQACRHAWVSGVRTRPITIPPGRGSKMLIVAFKKGKAFPFYPFSMSELTDLVVEADLVFGRRFHDLREQLLAAHSVGQRFQLVEAFLLQQADDAFRESLSATCVDYAMMNILCRPNVQRLRQLSEQIGYSQKHFINLFRNRVGVSPKQYLRIIRFQKAIHAIEKDESIPWSQIALESGFYDQAHFIHEFKNFSGFTPVEYMTRKANLLNYIPVQ